MNRKYRWLTEGDTRLYNPALGKGCDERRGQHCQVITVPRGGTKPGNILVQFSDGVRHIVPLGVLQKVKA